MNEILRKHTDEIVKTAIAGVMPDEAVKKALMNRHFSGKVYLVAVGKAAWQMAKAAYELLQDRITAGVVVTKYHHSKGPIGHLQCFEAGHPIPDENSFVGTQAALDMTADLTAEDTVLFLLSGGGSALFEKSLIDLQELQDITGQLLACGADIVEINTIRKRLSAVKGGKFGAHCAPAQVFSVVLSDIVGDPLDMIASGPACPDSTTCAQALEIVERYGLRISSKAMVCLNQETPKELTNIDTKITGSVRELCKGAENACRKLGYSPILLTDSLTCEAKTAGVMLAEKIKALAETQNKIALIAGGETVVKLTGQGKGGRNQELALAAAPVISGICGTAVFSVGSDGTDGPTEAAGGYVDWKTVEELRAWGIQISQVLADNDAYHALQKTNGLIVTGPTGTNVNDVAVALLWK